MEHTTRMPFGKYRGKPLEDVPRNYLKWLLANCENASPALLAEVHFLVSGDEPASKTAIAIPAVAAKWYRTLASEFHPDRGGTHEAMKVVNRANDLLYAICGGRVDDHGDGN